MTKLIKNDPLRLAKLEKDTELVNYESLWLANFTSKHTRASYKATLKDFCTYFNITDTQAFRGVHPADIVGYRDFLISKNYSNRSIRNKLASISSCFKFLVSKQVIQINPVKDIQRPKVDETKGETPVMIEEQVNLFLKQPDVQTLIGSRDYAILCMFFFTGSRIGAFGTIKMKDFYQDQGFHVLKWKIKGGANQVLPVAPVLQTALLHYLEKSIHKDNPNAPLFHAVRVDRNQGKPLSNKTFENVWHKYRKKAGLPKQFTPHSARATFATIASKRGVPLEQLQADLKHANISTTRMYVHSSGKHEDSAVFAVKY